MAVVVALTGALAVVPAAGAVPAGMTVSLPRVPSKAVAAPNSLGLAVTVTWRTVTGAASYRVHRSGSPGFTPGPDTLTSVGATAWAALVLSDAGMLWRPDGWAG